MGAFDPIVTYEKGTYIETDTGNKVSRKALISGATNIILGGKSIIHNGVILRGDLRRATAGQHVVISMGKYCVIHDGAVIRPPGRIYKGSFTFFPVKIGDFVSVGAGSIVEATSIGLGVDIGKDCVIGKFCSIKDLAVVLPGTVLPDGTNVPPLTVWGGNPGRLIEHAPETHQETIEAKSRSYYQRFRAA